MIDDALTTPISWSTFEPHELILRFKLYILVQQYVAWQEEIRKKEISRVAV